MAEPNLFLRGKTYWLRMRVNGEEVRVSTRTSNIEQARAFRDSFQSKARMRALDTQGPISLAILDKALRSSKARAKRDRMPNALTLAQMEILAAQCGGRCAVTGLPFNERKAPGMRMAPFAVSLDRIDNSKGYLLENCRLVCCAVNIAMNTWGEGPLLIIAKALVRTGLGDEIARAQIAHKEWILPRLSRKKPWESR